MTVAHDRIARPAAPVRRRPVEPNRPPPQPPILHLQRTIGNAAVQRLLVQRSLAVGPADDAREREADAAADAVARDGVADVSPSPAEPRSVRRKLVMTGAAAEVDPLLTLLGDAAGQMLARGADNRVSIAGAAQTAGKTSASLATLLGRVIGDAKQDAEVHVGRDQPRVAVGAFPVPGDLTKDRVQRIDLDDIQRMEKDIPGWGVSAAAHEIDENYRAHGLPVVPGKERRPETHEKAIETESAVSAELIEPGRRVADATDRSKSDRQTRAFDYSTHYRVLEMSIDKDGHVRVTGAKRMKKEKVSTHEAGRYGAGSDVATAAGVKAAMDAMADLRANPLATARLEGHTDGQNTATENDARALSRARTLRAGMVGQGVDEERFEVVNGGASNPVATGTTEDDRARNRRVEITVSRPA